MLLKNSQYRGLNDLEILKISEEKSYIILTFDKDFLVLRKKGSKLKCLILNLKTINIKYLISYLEMILKNTKKSLKEKPF